MSDTPGVPPPPGTAQLERLQQLDRRIAQTVGQLIGSLQDDVDRRLSEATGELQRLFEKMKPATPDLSGAFLQPEDLRELMPPAPEPVSVPVPVRMSLNESLGTLLEGLARIDGESGQAPILKALLEESRRFASRAAFLLIRGGEIRGWAGQDLPEGSLQETNFATFGGPFTRLLSAAGAVVLSESECVEVASALGVAAGWSGVLVPFQIRGQLAGALYADRLEAEEELGVSALQVLAYGAAQALETSQLRKGSSSSLRLGAGEQLPAAPQSSVPELTAPVPLVSDPNWQPPASEYGTPPASYESDTATEPYDAPSYQTPSYETPSYETPSYETPSYAAPAYEAPVPAVSGYDAESYDPVQSTAAPVYEAGGYEAPAAAAPSYETPSYETPSYEAPSYAAPSYEAPSYESFEAPRVDTPSYETPSYDSSYAVPSYEPPTVVTPSYDEAPSYEAPSYEAPSYEAPSYEAPSYEAQYTAPSYEPPAYEPPAYEPPVAEAPSYSYEPAPYEPAAYEPAPYEPPAESPSYDISYPSSFDVPAAEPAGYEPSFEMVPEEPAPSPAYADPAYAAPSYAAPAYEAPSYEAPSYEPPSYEPPSYTPPAYQPSSEPSSFDTSFEPAAAETYGAPTNSASGAPDDVRFAREPAYDLPSEEEIALEKQPEPALEDTNIWEAEEEDDEPTQIGQSTAAVPQVEAPPAAGGVGQQTVRLDISQLQNQASQLAQERYGDDTAPGMTAAAPAAPPAAAWQPPPAADPVWQSPAAPAAFAPTYSPSSFATPEPAYGGAPAYDQSEAPTMLGRPAAVPPPAAPAPPSSAGFAGPVATEQAPGGFGAGGFGAGEAKEPAGSTEVRPPADLVGPGLAFAAHSPGQRPAASGGVEETLREEARRLARLLVSEIKLYNEEIIDEGRRSGNIYDRLKDDIDRSRQMYEERIDPRLTDQEDYFYQELVQRLAGGDAKLLGL